MNTMANETCVTCGYDNSRNHWDCLCHDILGNCECPTPAQSEASEPAEGEESKLRFDLQLIRNEKGSLEWIEDEPADHPDLVSEEMLHEAAEFFNKNIDLFSEAALKFDGSTIAAGIAKFAHGQIRRQQATSPDAVIDEFVERVANGVDDEAWNDRKESGYSLKELLEWAMRSVAEEMKRK